MAWERQTSLAPTAAIQIAITAHGTMRPVRAAAAALREGAKYLATK
jgi:hypothetical protein